MWSTDDSSDDETNPTKAPTGYSTMNPKDEDDQSEESEEDAEAYEQYLLHKNDKNYHNTIHVDDDASPGNNQFYSIGDIPNRGSMKEIYK